jgi:type I restriction enzyme, S subunit
VTNLLNEALQHYPFSIEALPENWSLVTLSDIAIEIAPGFASGKHSSDGKGVPHLRPMNIDREGKIDLSVVKFVASTGGIELAAGDILFNNTNSPELIGKTAVVSRREHGFAFSNHMTCVRLDEGIVSSFIAQQLHFLWMVGYMKYRCTNHVNQASISTKTLAKSIPILIPPTNEQTCIVEKLEELLSNLDAGVVELKAARKKMTQYRQALLKAAVEGALTADWRARRATHGEPLETGAQLLARILAERRRRWEEKLLARFAEQGRTPPKDWQRKYPEPVQPDTSELPELPEEWAWASVEQLGYVQLGRQRSPAKLTGKNPVKYIRAANITEAGINFSDVLEMDFTETERETFQLKQGDVLLTEASGSPEHVGRPAVWPDIEGLYCFQNTVIRFTPLIIGSQFSFRVFQAWQKLGRFVRVAGGVGINHLSAGKFSSIPVPLPPLEEQQAIVEELDLMMVGVEQLENNVSLSLRQSEAEHKNILKAAFAGQLVPQDPHDEPASVLLERIQAERAVRSKQPKPRHAKLPKREVEILMTKLIDVLTEAKDWLAAEEAFRRCGVADGTPTDRIEELYVELRELDQARRLDVRRVNQFDELKLRAEV